MKTKVFVLLLNYNNPHDTVEAARSLRRSDLPQDSQIIIIDNGITDQSKYFANKIVGSIYLKSPSNHGFAAGNNLGIKYALGRKATHILIINPDVRVSKIFFAPLVNTLKGHKNAGIVAPAHREPGSHRYGLGGKINWQNCSFPHDNATVLPKEELRYDLLTFACVLIKAEVFEDVGLLDERYFMYLEDVDYCLRTKNAGYELWLNPMVCITHRTSSSFSDPRKKIRMSFDSCLIFIKKWYHFPSNLIPILHTIYYYPYTYVLWTAKLYKQKVLQYVKKNKN